MQTYLFFTPSEIEEHTLKALVEAKHGGWLPEHHCGFISGENKNESSIYVRMDTSYPEGYSGEVQKYITSQIGQTNIKAVEVQVSEDGADSSLLHDFYYAMYYCWKGFLWNGEMPKKQLAS